jgi:hypothetical protein
MLQALEWCVVDSVAGLGMALAWLTVSPTHVREDGNTYGGLDWGRE